MDETLMGAIAREVAACRTEVEKRKAILTVLLEERRDALLRDDFRVDTHSTASLEIDFFVKQELRQTVQACEKLLSVLDRAQKRAKKAARKPQQKP